MKKVVLTRPLPGECVEEFAGRIEFVTADRREDVAALLADAQGLVTAGIMPVDEELLAAAGDGFRVVGTTSVGYDHIDVEACGRRGCRVVHAPQAVLRPTAELTVGLVLAVMRGIVRCDRELRDSLRVGLPFFPEGMATLYGKSAGIVGFGRIGRAVAGMLHAFGMRILYTDVARAAPEDEAACGARYLGFEELLEQSDLVTLHCPYLPENHHMMGAGEFRRMKRTAFFVNAARGKLVNEAALVRALERGEIAGAGLDVFEDEPAVTPRLAELDNAVIVPHIGTATRDVRIEMCRECLRGVAAVLEGEEPPNLVAR